MSLDGRSLEYEATDEITDVVARGYAGQGFTVRAHHSVALLYALLCLGAVLVLAWLGAPPFLHAVVAVCFAGALVPYLCVVIGPLYRPLIVWRVRRGLQEAFRGLPHRRVRWTFTADRFRAETAKAATDAAWADVAELQALDAVWVWRLKSGHRLVVPASALPPDLPPLLRQKAAEAGVLVRGPGEPRPRLPEWEAKVAQARRQLVFLILLTVAGLLSIAGLHLALGL